MSLQVIEWDGQHIPAGLNNLPVGRYVLEPIGYEGPLSLDEETGILAGLDQLDRGEVCSVADVLKEIRDGLTK
jgi:hypothetical protein